MIWPATRRGPLCDGICTIAQTPYKATICLNKVSAVLLDRYIFTQPIHRVACWTMLVIVVGLSVGTVFAVIFEGVRAEGPWDRDLETNCMDKGAF